MDFHFGSGFKQRAVAAALLFAAMVGALPVNAASSPSDVTSATTHPSHTALDDQEDDVTAFFTSGAYTKQLTIPLIAAGCFLGFLGAAAFAATKRAAQDRRLL